MPGVSRSGATISMALFLGYRREEAARFSFLLATAHHARSGPGQGAGPPAGTADPTAVVLGMAAAAVFGFLTIRFLLGYVRTRDYRPFVYYRLLFAFWSSAYFWSGRANLG